MKEAIRLFLLALIICGLVGCGIVSREISNVETPSEQSTFKQNYSIGLIVEAHKDLLIDGPRALSGSEAGPRVPFVQNQEVMIVQVNQDNASQFMESIQSDIAEMISSTATIAGSSGFDGRADPIAYFSYSYREGPFYGVLDVWGIRGEGTQFILISQITESMDNAGG